MPFLPPFRLVWRAVTIVVGLAATLPERNGGLVSHAHPAGSYAEAVRLATARQTADDSVAAPGGESILLVHGHRTPRSVVLLHGFTDSPRQFAVLAEQLYREGDNVYVPRLPHHAERSEDVAVLGKLTAEQLAACGDSAIDVAAGLGDSVVVLGLSAGANVAAWSAQHRPEVYRAVLVAPAFEAGRVPSMLDKPLIKLTTRAPNVTKRAPTDSTRPDWDPGFATHALGQILRLGLVVRQAADRDPPEAHEIAFLLNKNDHTVKASAAIDLARKWLARGAAITVYDFPDSLRLPHSLVDGPHHRGDPAVVYPVLEELTHGKHPAAPVYAAALR